MASKKRYAVVFVHGLAKKPAPEKLVLARSLRPRGRGAFETGGRRSRAR